MSLLVSKYQAWPRYKNKVTFGQKIGLEWDTRWTFSRPSRACSNWFMLWILSNSFSNYICCFKVLNSVFSSECGTKLPLLSLVLTIDGAFKMQLNLTCYKFSHDGRNLNHWSTTLTNCLIQVFSSNHLLKVWQFDNVKKLLPVQNSGFTLHA